MKATMALYVAVYILTISAAVGIVFQTHMLITFGTTRPSYTVFT